MARIRSSNIPIVEASIIPKHMKAMFLRVLGSSLLPETNAIPDRKMITIKTIAKRMIKERVDGTRSLAPKEYAKTIASIVAHVLKITSRIFAYFS